MDEREQELSELRNYGHKLLEEMKYPSIIAMLQETITHMADIAEEYSREADKWHSKYDECAEQNRNLQRQIEDLTKAGEQKNNELCTVISKQAEQIKSMSHDFEQKLDELRSYRNQEVEGYRDKVQALISTQATLDKLISDVEAEKRQLEDKIRQCDKEKAEYENKQLEYEIQIEDNRTKLDEYPGLFNYKLNAENKIAEAQKAADDKVDEANRKVDDLTKKYNDEVELRKKLEEELGKLKDQLQGNTDNPTSEELNCQDDVVERREEQSAHDDDDDGTR